MTPAEVIRAALKVLQEQGWCQGSNAVDRMGAPIHLYEEGLDGRRINPRACGFSIYGAIAKVMSSSGSSVPKAGLMWDTLNRLASVSGLKAAETHHSHIHPLVMWNEHIDRTAEEVFGFMERAAEELEKADSVRDEPSIEQRAYGDQQRKELPKTAAEMVDGRLDLPPEPVAVGLDGPMVVPVGPELDVIDDPIPPEPVTGIRTERIPAGTIIGQAGFPKTPPPIQRDVSPDPRLPNVDWS